jgi:hypothetical protein
MTHEKKAINANPKEVPKPNQLLPSRKPKKKAVSKPNSISK